MLALVLGGGAAKGYAHIGVIKYLEEIGIKPQLIVGASMGALIGGFYAAGYSIKEIEDIARKVDRKTKRWLFAIHLSKKGFINGKNVIKYLTPYLSGKKIEELPIGYASVATDIENSAEVIIDKGDLIHAIRSSISIPVVFVPHLYKGRLLIDGGFVNPLPITVAQKLGAKKVIAVNVLRRVDYKSQRLSDLRTKPRTAKRTYNIKQILTETVEDATSRLIDYEEMQLKNGLVININTEGIGMSQFEKAHEAIELGYTQAKKFSGSVILSKIFLHAGSFPGLP